MSQENKRITIDEAKQKSKEELIQYLRDLYPYCTNFNYINFVKYLVGEDYQQGDIWLVGQVQEHTGNNKKWLTIGNIGKNIYSRPEQLNPFKYMRELNADEKKRENSKIENSNKRRALYTWNSDENCVAIKDELEDLDVVIAKIEIKDNRSEKSAKNVGDLLYVSNYQKLADDAYYYFDIANIGKKRETKGIYSKVKEYFKKEDIIKKQSHSLLVSGSPGAGKSNFVDKVFLKNLYVGVESEEKLYERFIINDSVTYEDLIGSYRPVQIGQIVKYEFVPGPFIRLYEKAKQIEKIRNNNKTGIFGHLCGLCKNYVLILEELSRGDAYNILGDLYLLLERDEEGESKYSVSIDHHLSEYLTKSLGEKEPVQSIKLPSNFFVIATMNNADAGVSYLDASIRRRFTPIFIDHEGNRFGDNYTEIKSEDMQISTNELLNIEKIDKDDAKELIGKINEKLESDKKIAPAILNNPIYQEGINIIDLFNMLVGYLTQYVYRNDGEHQSFTWYLEKGNEKNKSLMTFLRGKKSVTKEDLFGLFRSWELIN